MLTISNFFEHLYHFVRVLATIFHEFLNKFAKLNNIFFSKVLSSYVETKIDPGKELLNRNSIVLFPQ